MYCTVYKAYNAFLAFRGGKEDRGDYEKTRNKMRDQTKGLCFFYLLSLG